MDKSEQQANLIEEKILFDGILNNDEKQNANDSEMLAKEYQAGVDYEMQLRFHHHIKKDKEQ